MGALAFCFDDYLVAANDNFTRLTKATKADGNVLNFRYDVDGLRMETIKNSTGITPNLQFAGGVHTRYVTSATEELADLDGNRAVIRRYVAGPAIDERIAQVDANGAVTYVHTDKQNSVVALTNATGNAVSRRGYGEYGQTSATQMAETTHPFGYTGRRYEAELGLYYYRARWYDPELGTFLETDPIGSLDYINLYSYVGLDPMGKTDPSGLQNYDPVAQRDAALYTALSYCKTEACVREWMDMHNANEAREAGIQLGFVPWGSAFKAAQASVWTLGWGSRGMAIESRLGGNLPLFFPTIDKFSRGIATSIKSINLNARTYQNMSRLQGQLNKHVDAVARFAGGSGGGQTIRNSEIVARELIVAVPEGSLNAANTAVLNAARARASEMGVTMRWVTVK
ncbi:MAG: RHS Repeat family [Hyphomonadaceae bacterium]|nr:MAG: RHS Repeat family [Hyphomonadaceae bacterium]